MQPTNDAPAPDTLDSSDVADALLEVDQRWLRRLAEVSADAAGAAVAPYSTGSALGAAACAATLPAVVLLLDASSWWLLGPTGVATLLVWAWAALQIRAGRAWERLGAEWTAERSPLVERLEAERTAS